MLCETAGYGKFRKCSLSSKTKPLQLLTSPLQIALCYVELYLDSVQRKASQLSSKGCTPRCPITSYCITSLLHQNTLHHHYIIMHYIIITSFALGHIALHHIALHHHYLIIVSHPCNVATTVIGSRYAVKESNTSGELHGNVANLKLGN